MSTYPTPDDLARGLRDGEPAARARFEEVLHGPLLKLFERLAAEHRLRYPPEYLLRRALRLAEVHVRSRSAGAYRDGSWKAFLGDGLVHVARLLEQPHGKATLAAAAALPDDAAYQCQAYSRPFETVGDAAFGGDWYVGQHDAGGALWLFLADITGHGYSAYLLASALPLLWRMAWEKQGPSLDPTDLLTTMHHLLEGVLPEGIYVEGTLVKLQPEGDAVLVAAGGTRVLLRREGTLQPDLLKYRGCWLGMMAPERGEEHHLRLGPGDELVVATDGLFDQLEGFRGQDLAGHIQGVTSARLFDWLHGLVQESLAAGPQKDDITLVLLRRRFAARGAPTPATPRAADVPV